MKLKTSQILKGGLAVQQGSDEKPPPRRDEHTGFYGLRFMRAFSKRLHAHAALLQLQLWGSYGSPS